MCFQDRKAKAENSGGASHVPTAGQCKAGNIARHDISVWSGTKGQDNWSSQVVPVVDVVPRGIRLRFNEHANDRGGARGVQRGPTFASTCFPRVSFARYCKTGREEETRFHFGQLARHVASHLVASRLAVPFCCSTLRPPPLSFFLSISSVASLFNFDHRPCAYLRLVYFAITLSTR